MNTEKIKQGAGAILIIGVAYFLINRGKTNTENTVVSPDANQNGGYISDPVLAAYNPNTAPQDININIANQGLNYLNSNYIPLFGFIGMMQGDFQQNTPAATADQRVTLTPVEMAPAKSQSIPLAQSAPAVQTAPIRNMIMAAPAQNSNMSWNY